MGFIANCIAVIRTIATAITEPDGLANLINWLRGDVNLYTGGARQYTAANNEYHSHADSAFFSTGDIDFLIATWVYLDSKPASYMSAVAKWDTDPQNEWLITWPQSSDVMRFAVSADGTAAVTVDTASAPALNTWYFVVAWHDSTANTINIQMNNATAVSQAHSTGVIDSTAAVEIGHIDQEASGTAHWDGRVARTIFAKNSAARAIIDDADLRTWLYNLGNGRTSGEVAAHATLGPLLDGVSMDTWNGNEAAGNLLSYSGLNDLTDNASVTVADGPGTDTAEDSSSNENEGLLTGFTSSIAWKTDTTHLTYDPTCKDTSGNNYHLQLIGADASSASDEEGSEYPRDLTVPSGGGVTQALAADGVLYGLFQTSPLYLKSATEFRIKFYSDITSADVAAAEFWILGSSTANLSLDGLQILFADAGGSWAPNDGIAVGVATATGTQRIMIWDDIIAGLSAGYHLYEISYDSTNFGRIWIDGDEKTVSRTPASGTGDFTPRNYKMAVGAKDDGTKLWPASRHIANFKMYSDAAATTLIAECLFEESNLRNLPLIGAGKSLAFDGTDDYVDIDGVVADVASDTAGSWSCWVKPTDATPSSPERLIGFGDTNANEFLFITINTDGSFKGNCKDAGSAKWTCETGAAVFSDNTWTHCALVHDGTAPVLYINGQLVAITFSVSNDKTKWFSALTGLDNARMGCVNQNSVGNAGFLNGNLDEVQIWSSALTATEIYDLYTGTQPAAATVGYWKLDDGPQEPLADGDTVLEWMSRDGSLTQYQQSDASKRPLAALGVNGIANRDAVDFDGVDDVLRHAGTPFATNNAGTIAVTCCPDDVSSEQVLFGSSDEGGTANYLILGTDASAKVFLEVQAGGATHRVTGNTVLVAGTKYSIYATISGSAWVLWVGNNEQTLTVTVSNSGKWFNDLVGADNMTIGALQHTSVVKPFSGKISDVAVYSSVLDATNLTKLMIYGTNRYGT